MLSTSTLKRHSFSILIMTVLFSTQTFAVAIKESGAINSINGDAWASQADLPKRTLTERSVVYENDEITTGTNSSLEILFKDKTTFKLGPESSFVITNFNYKNSTDEDNLAVKMLKGSFRFISGLIAKRKPKSMAVNTTVATIGIRGTHVAGEVDATSAKIVLMEKEDPTAENKIEVFNEYGSVTIDEPGYGTEIPDEFSPPSPVRRMRLQSINNLTRSLQSIQRSNVPAPRPPRIR